MILWSIFGFCGAPEAEFVKQVHLYLQEQLHDTGLSGC